MSKVRGLFVCDSGEVIENVSLVITARRDHPTRRRGRTVRVRPTIHIPAALTRRIHRAEDALLQMQHPAGNDPSPAPLIEAAPREEQRVDTTPEPAHLAKVLRFRGRIRIVEDNPLPGVLKHLPNQRSNPDANL